ncbi:hypothetical protein SAMN05421876_102344 [Kaistella jeonii]|uniref:EpsG family protein n=2 Tax=Kaistella jeonii TaxID=266749 RepID=A0A0C1FPX6_9FLAO|nr:hypothetical protein OA86_04765 [Kaistella jeonii]SFB81023.1 hypothetical protein SAMN05421876_102344 [Kaistella jeonii]VEI96172.1 Uncharacterised protein [Kaistella jeonii]
MLLAFTVNSFIYFSFGNIYSSKILNYTDFSQQFHSGIYQYRILSGYFLIWIYDFLSTLNIDYKIFKLKFLDPNSEPQMYLSFYILNTFFMVLSAAILVFITETKNFVATNAEKILISSVAIFAIAFSQFVIVPYDVSSYFFLLLFFYFLLQYLQKRSTLPLAFLMILILISTLNRESSALSLSLAATLLNSKFGLKKEMIQPIFFLAITFIAVYFGMRFLNQSFSTNDGNLLAQNFTEPKNILGLLFWITFFIFTLIIAKDLQTKRYILIFHLLSLPYIMMCFYTGIIYEIRLYIPLFLTSILLGRTELSRIH